MATLFNTRISDTYQGLIKTIDNTAITASLKELTDGSGNLTGILLNNAGDFKVTSILEFGSLKDTGENIIITKFVDAGDGIANNDNDTTIPTTAAIIDYVAAQITIEDLDFTGDTGSGQIDLDSQIFAIGGTTNEITTVASGQSITFSLDSTGVNLPDNSTAITQTAGDNSTKIATTSYVDTLDAASDLDITDGTNTGDVNLNTQSLSILGTTNEIESVVSGQSVTIGLPSTINTNLVGNVTGNLTGDVVGDLTGNVTSTSVLANGVTATTQSSSDDSTKVATTAYVKGLNNASDLDFSTDSGSGAVVLNSETLSVVGTTNEIETSGTGQEIQIGLPSSISTNLVGNVTGNLTGNVIGDVTGDLTGNSAGTHTGAVIGNVTGNVTGDLTGNADTATAWETARDLSVTGQASATITGVDGTSNVSASITLDNNSVTSKVLTGLPTPAASSVLATDSIVQGIGKLQSQINGLAGGLRFMGSWDATNNNPSLSSGGGEATSGTTTSTTANKLVDSSASFLTTVTIGDQVINQVDGQNALVSNVDSNTTLSLDNDIMVSGEAYTIDNSPFITQGHYYVVNVGGTTTLNGISNWSVGDWVIAGANNEWTKLDHTQIDGTGTGDANDGNIPRFTASNIIGDSIIRETGGNLITVSGTLSTTGNLNAQGDFAINTDKFTTQASTGNTAFAGDLAINTNKFTVNATNGNTATAGNVTVGGSGTFAENVTIGDNRSIISNGSVRIDIDNDNNSTTRAFIVRNDGGTNELFKVQEDGNSTFAGTIYASNNNPAYSFASDTNTGMSRTGTHQIGFINQGNTSLTLDALSNATFAGNLLATGTGRFEDDLTIYNGSPEMYYLTSSSSHYNWMLAAQENVDGAFEITPSNAVGTGGVFNTPAFRLDASTRNATFAGNITVGGHISLNTNDDSRISGDSDSIDFNLWDNSSAYQTRMTILDTGNVGIGTDSPFEDLEINRDNSSPTLIVKASGQTSSTTPTASLFLSPGSFSSNTTAPRIIGYRTADFSSAAARSAGLKFGVAQNNVAKDAMWITEAGNVGIGTASPSVELHVKDSSQNSSITDTIPSWWNAIFERSYTTSSLAAVGLIGGTEATGSAGALYLGYSDNVDSNYILVESNDLLFGVNGSERMRIDSSGNVGINEDNPSAQIHNLQKTNDRAGGFYSQLAGNTYGVSMFVNSGGYGIIGSNGAYTTDVLTMDLNSGNLGIGEDAPGTLLSLKGAADTSIITLKCTKNDSSWNGERIGGINFFSEDGSGPGAGIRGSINYVADSSSGGNTAMTFKTGDNTERMRITSGGDITVSGGDLFLNSGTSYNDKGVVYFSNERTAIISDIVNATANGDTSLDFQTRKSGTRASAMFIDENRNVLFRATSVPSASNLVGSGFKYDSKSRATLVQASDNNNLTDLQEYFNTDGAVGKIQTNGTATLFTTSSDYRLKEDLQEFNGLEKVSNIKVYDFKWKTNGRRSYGVMAHELQEVLPQAVGGEKDAIKENGEINTQTVDYSKIVPLLVKSIQELKAEVDLLKQECKCKN